MIFRVFDQRRIGECPIIMNGNTGCAAPTARKNPPTNYGRREIPSATADGPPGWKPTDCRAKNVAAWAAVAMGYRFPMGSGTIRHDGPPQDPFDCYRAADRIRDCHRRIGTAAASGERGGRRHWPLPPAFGGCDGRFRRGE